MTFVGSTVDDLLEGGAGVCQDFVHLALILLRRHGIAARYVSGLFAAPEDGGTDSVEVDTRLDRGAPGLERRRPAWVGADRRTARLAGETTSRSATAGSTVTSLRSRASTASRRRGRP